MTSIGDTLRRERQRRHLEIPQIAGELRISSRFLEAMEQDEFAKLPGGVFTRSFVRQYGDFLGLDGEALVAEMGRAAAPEPETPELSHKPKPDVPGIELNFGNNWQSVGDRPAALPSWLKAGMLLVALMVVCSGVYWWWWERPHHQVVARETGPAAPVVAAPKPALAVLHPAGNPQADALPAANPPVASPAEPQAAAGQDVKPAPPATPEIPVSTPNPKATVRVGITADEIVWIKAEVNGKYLFQGTLQPHETRTIDADGEVRLRLGKAGGATLTLNGKPVGAVGPKGQIRDIQFTSGGFQVVPPPKSLDPPDHF